ncbi:MAG: hypothetical protein DI546_14120 [Rhizobium sp.]|nr:MAG: hypothetical protein DI546_14120 [Rhizobium sp.]
MIALVGGSQIGAAASRAATDTVIAGVLSATAAPTGQRTQAWIPDGPNVQTVERKRLQRECPAIGFPPIPSSLSSFSLNWMVSADPGCYQLANNRRGGALCRWLLRDSRIQAS